jgi:uncharacterized membrane protein
MGKSRLEAFSDGVIAIIITIMVLELKVPPGGTLAALRPLTGVFLGYVLSFVFIGIYWNNHHHLIHTVQKVTGGILWANLHLLFWLSLVPFATGWMGANGLAPLPVALYGVILLLAAVAYSILARVIIASHGSGSVLARAVGTNRKGDLSLALYVLAVVLALWFPWLACLIYVTVAAIWLIPDRRIERVLGGQPER